MPDLFYPESAVDLDIREEHSWRPLPLCVPEMLSSRAWMVVLMLGSLEDINSYPTTIGSMRMEPHEAGAFVCFVYHYGFSSQNRTQWAYSKELKIRRDQKIGDQTKFK